VATDYSGERWEMWFPWIAFREPWKAEMGPASGFLCRVCVANIGIKGYQVERLFATAEECAEHIATHFRLNWVFSRKAWYDGAEGEPL
jgi:hypothetical protein